MATEFHLRPVVVIAIGLIVVIFILGSIIYGGATPLIKSIADLFPSNQTETNIAEVSDNIPFYNEFIKNYKECKLSPSVDCFCSLTNPTVPENYIIQVKNNPSSKTTSILLHSNARLNKCNAISPTKELKDIQTIQTDITDDLLYFKNYVFYPTIAQEQTKEVEVPSSSGILAGVYRRAYLKEEPSKIQQAQLGKLKKEEFTQADNLFLYNLNLCSSKDVSGNDEISFTKGIIYKFSNEETTLISGFTGLKRCATIKDALPADEQFIKLISTINECKQGPCAFSIISAEGIESVIPKDYEIIIEGQKLTLQYKEEKVKTAEIKKEMCLFSDFREITLENSKPLTKLIFNNYIGAEFYAFDNKICVLPYTPEIKKQKDLLLEKLKTRSLIPT